MMMAEFDDTDGDGFATAESTSEEASGSLPAAHADLDPQPFSPHSQWPGAAAAAAAAVSAADAGMVSVGLDDELAPDEEAFDGGDFGEWTGEPKVDEHEVDWDGIRIDNES